MMDPSSSTPRVWKNGRLQEVDRQDVALAALCQAVERTVRAHQTGAASVRAVILMIDEPAARADRPHAPEASHAPVPVYVDVFDSGLGHDSGYGHGI